MNTVLIVEDEKLIRQGIHTMVQRSGVPVEVIMECANGEEALKILSAQKVDVMFTDIRMQKMDGIELVKEVSKLKEKPLMVAVSGYDDFTYAVEMLRNGVKEYLLKPVEREKITEVLRKLEAELENKNLMETEDVKLGMHRMKNLMLGEHITEEEKTDLISRYESQFYKEPYCVIVLPRKALSSDAGASTSGHLVILEDVYGADVCFLEEKFIQPFILNELPGVSAGISSPHEGMESLQEAYKEALNARHYSFIRGGILYPEDTAPRRIPDLFRQQGEKLLEQSAHERRIQLTGTDKTEDLVKEWDAFFAAAEKEMLTVEEFFDEMESGLSELTGVFGEKANRDLPEGEEKTEDTGPESVIMYNSLVDFRGAFMDRLLEMHEELSSRKEENRSDQKMKLAVEYIEANYQSDLNMAVVSNYVSMNYSLFSYSFKQYTGQNFVNFLKEIRIREAKKLLESTDEKIIEIAQKVGYDNEKHFMKIFKATCGVSPSEYRRNMQHI
ncbi:MAG: response regulator [Lachnospiraceae bacterium]|nr:response regulator [Lachnospiraceae bacterium]